MNSPASDLKYWRFFAARRRTQKAYHRSRKAEDRTVHNRINAALRRHSKRLQKQSFVNFVTNVNAHTPPREIWSTVHALSGDRGPVQPFACLSHSVTVYWAKVQWCKPSMNYRIKESLKVCHWMLPSSIHAMPTRDDMPCHDTTAQREHSVLHKVERHANLPLLATVM